ncbi:unnamed protein product [Rotaria sp. Silwood1]|nr:unnamed protein product [Rotaria sp. Silwood1]CAF0739465.1 unnamed protein product [Rotaria sp. Silwood1]CAF0794453.1 unnamed protein product [Rotaria sp. Silwood1]CAF3333289.1 unnamed protein product [Rotaria sp. Silwood1]CAF3349372.1 unnamed protein product [Rotaria sp. Silwood1]
MLNRLILLIIFSSSLWFVVNCGDEFEDYRCRCVCPSLTVLQDPTVNETNRRVYVDVVAPDNCTCERVVFRTMKVSPSFQQRFCPRCVCNYEVRNTTTMKVVVIIIMVAISLLFIYMSFLLCLDPLMNQNTKTSTTVRQPKQYQRQVNEEVNLSNPTQECVFSEPAATGLPINPQRSSTVLNLVTHEQSKWRKQVQQQRQSVYNKHEILN